MLAARNSRLVSWPVYFLSALWLVLNWFGERFLDKCCSGKADSLSGQIMTWISEWEGSISWALGGAFAIVFLANLLHWIKNMRRKGIPQISGIVVDANGLAERGIVMEGAAHIEDVAVINARETGILLHGAADAIATNSYVEGNGETIGFDVAGSPNANLSGSVSRNNKVGFRVRNSDSLDLSNSRAEQDEPRPREGRARKSYPVRLPENMKKK